MAIYRLLEPVSYVADGKVVSVDGDRLVDLDDDQAKSLAGRIVLIESAESMFPDGTPIIPAHITPTAPLTSEIEVPLPPTVAHKKVK